MNEVAKTRGGYEGGRKGRNHRKTKRGKGEGEVVERRGEEEHVWEDEWEEFGEARLESSTHLEEQQGCLSGHGIFELLISTNSTLFPWAFPFSLHQRFFYDLTISPFTNKRVYCVEG